MILSKISFNDIKYNLLSLINVIVSFIFIILLGRKFGAGNETDLYFISLTIISYLSIIVKSLWTAIKQYYIEFKINDKLYANQVYNIIFNNILIASLIIICLYYLITLNFGLLSYENQEFLNIFIFYILFQNLLNFNKIILSLEHHFASIYISDLILSFGNLILIFFYLEENILLLAYSTLFFSFLSLIYQMYLIYFKININYEFVFFKKELLNTIYKNSLKMNIGGLLYSFKDILIVTVLTTYGTGIYSLFSYANKFIGVILLIVNAPILNIFVTKITHIIAQSKYSLLSLNVNKILLKITILYIVSVFITYFILPYVLSILFSGKFSINDIEIIQYLFILLSINYLAVSIEGPYLTVINLFKMFNYVLIVNFSFFILILIGYMLYNKFEFTYSEFFIVLIFVQFTNTLLYTYKYKSIEREYSGR